MHSTTSQELAKLGEQLAVEFLLSKSYKILCRNYRKRWSGEIDIIALRADDSIRLVEVKTRVSEEYLSLNELITKDKVHYLNRTIKKWCSENQINYVMASIGIDYIGLIIDQKSSLVKKLVYYENLETIKYLVERY
jgi:putative endonuclease